NNLHQPVPIQVVLSALKPESPLAVVVGIKYFIFAKSIYELAAPASGRLIVLRERYGSLLTSS
ncbi:MAG: hypothetical protein K8S18_04310, partial [Desulfobacula sp.]|nr:hypothetical protein [Desulfobacula sp.]